MFKKIRQNIFEHKITRCKITLFSLIYSVSNSMAQNSQHQTTITTNPQASIQSGKTRNIDLDSKIKTTEEHQKLSEDEQFKLKQLDEEAILKEKEEHEKKMIKTENRECFCVSNLGIDLFRQMKDELDQLRADFQNSSQQSFPNSQNSPQSTQPKVQQHTILNNSSQNIPSVPQNIPSVPQNIPSASQNVQSAPQNIPSKIVSYIPNGSIIIKPSGAMIIIGEDDSSNSQNVQANTPTEVKPTQVNIKNEHINFAKDVLNKSISDLIPDIKTRKAAVQIMTFDQILPEQLAAFSRASKDKFQSDTLSQALNILNKEINS